jgi:signal transduction histidine kinase
MQLFIRTRLGKRFLGAFFVLFIPFIAAGWLSIQIATELLHGQTNLLLRVASNGAEAQLREFLNSLKRITEACAAEPEIISALQSGEQGSYDLGDLVQQVRERSPELRAIVCMDLEGKVIASSSPEYLGKDESNSPEFQQGQNSYFCGDIVRDPGTGLVRWRMSAPVKDPWTQQLLGVVAADFFAETLSALTTGKRMLKYGAGTESFRIGETGETYIVNKDGLLLTELRFANHSAFLRKMETAPVRVALERGEGIFAQYKDYRGVLVSGTSVPLTEYGWVLITEIDSRQAYASIKNLRNKLIGVAILFGLGSVVIATEFARRIVSPLRLASEADQALAKGRHSSAIVPENHLPDDEIGDFIRQRNANVKKLFQHELALHQEQEKRIEAAAALEGITYSMVHDMRAPLRTVSTFGDLLRDEASDCLNDTQKDYLSRMKNSCLKMDRLICDMLRYSSLLQSEMRLSSVNVPELVDKLIDSSSVFNAHKADMQIDSAIPEVHANAAVLTQCFSILLDNAFKYTKPGVAPKVRVWAEKQHDWVRLFVEDNGVGMSKKFQEKVFGIFQKGSHSTEGSGMGLAMMRVAVERMGGRVGVTSEEGKGSRFSIALRVPPEAMFSSPPEPGPQNP